MIFVSSQECERASASAASSGGARISLEQETPSYLVQWGEEGGEKRISPETVHHSILKYMHGKESMPLSD